MIPPILSLARMRTSQHFRDRLGEWLTNARFVAASKSSRIPRARPRLQGRASTGDTFTRFTAGHTGRAMHSAPSARNFAIKSTNSSATAFWNGYDGAARASLSRRTDGKAKCGMCAPRAGVEETTSCTKNWPDAGLVHARWCASRASDRTAPSGSGASSTSRGESPEKPLASSRGAV